MDDAAGCRKAQRNNQPEHDMTTMLPEAELTAIATGQVNLQALAKSL
ncbi:hypothetical protein [Delftia deserti]|uniref:Uncharacterized protein n=1 Tax=Delftia deserti TaxID=1651218 RepID=A0ABW5EMC4_9BURK